MDLKDIDLDAGQRVAFLAFQQLHQALLQPRWKTLFTDKPKGIYCYGHVGRGKTLLMDLFYHHLPLNHKQRIHFHAFMQQIHQQLHQLKGEKNPLQIIAKEWAKKAHLLCLDEMMVDDVADAMILAQVFTALHQAGVILVMTSNTAPDDLYRNGVQKERFLAAINLIKQYTHVVFIGEGEDYRRKILSESGMFFTPINPDNTARMQQEFLLLTHGEFENNKTITINDHLFKSHQCGLHVVWFSFYELCEKPRAYTDYLQMVEQFKVIFLSDVPILYAKDDAAARRFVHFIDILYDHKTTLIVSAQGPIAELYQGSSLKSEFARTQSRLFEMQFVKK